MGFSLVHTQSRVFLHQGGLEVALRYWNWQEHHHHHVGVFSHLPLPLPDLVLPLLPLLVQGM